MNTATKIILVCLGLFGIGCLCYHASPRVKKEITTITNAIDEIDFGDEASPPTTQSTSTDEEEDESSSSSSDDE